MPLVAAEDLYTRFFGDSKIGAERIKKVGRVRQEEELLGKKRKNKFAIKVDGCLQKFAKGAKGEYRIPAGEQLAGTERWDRFYGKNRLRRLSWLLDVIGFCPLEHEVFICWMVLRRPGVVSNVASSRD